MPILYITMPLGAKLIIVAIIVIIVLLIFRSSSSGSGSGSGSGSQSQFNVFNPAVQMYNLPSEDSIICTSIASNPNMCINNPSDAPIVCERMPNCGGYVTVQDLKTGNMAIALINELKFDGNHNIENNIQILYYHKTDLLNKKPSPIMVDKPNSYDAGVDPNPSYYGNSYTTEADPESGVDADNPLGDSDDFVELLNTFSPARDIGSNIVAYTSECGLDPTISVNGQLTACIINLDDAEEACIQNDKCIGYLELSITDSMIMFSRPQQLAMLMTTTELIDNLNFTNVLFHGRERQVI